MKYKIPTILTIMFLLLAFAPSASAVEGDVIWSTGANVQGIVSTVIGPDGTIYVGNTDGQVYTIDPLTGDETLVFTCPGAYIYYSNLILSPDGETLYVPDEGTYKIHALSTDDFSEQWTYQASYIFVPMIVDADGYIYLVNGAAKITKIDPADGTKVWDYTAGSDDLGGPIAINSDGTQLALGFDDYGGYIEIIDTSDGSLIYTSYVDPWDLVFGDYENPGMAFDQNDDIVFTGFGRGDGVTAIVRMTTAGVVTEGGTAGADGVASADFNVVTFTDDFRIVSPRMEPAATIVSVYDTDLTELFHINQSDIGASACDDRDYIDCLGTISEDNIYYTVITRGGGTGQDNYGTGILAVDVDAQETEWFLETNVQTDYGASSVALMTNPVTQLICYGDDTMGLMAIEVSAGPLWDRTDFENGDIGMWNGLTQNQFLLPAEEVVVEEEDDDDGGYTDEELEWYAYKLELLEEEKQTVEPTTPEVEDTTTATFFGMSTASSPWMWLIGAIVLIGGIIFFMNRGKKTSKK